MLCFPRYRFVKASWLQSGSCFKTLLGIFFLGASLLSCQNNTEPGLRYTKPEYRPIVLSASGDTISFALSDSTFNNIRSLNYFSSDESDYIGLYDKMSISYSVYDFNSQKMVKRIRLDSCIPHKRLEKHTTVFCRNLDSLFVINELTMYLLDRALTVKDTIDFQTDPIMVFGSFGTGRPPLVLNDRIYLAATPFLSRRKKRDIKKWRLLYQIDMKEHSTDLLFKLPKRYLDSLYGYYFFDANYCLNNSGRVVFSFPADSNVYEFDLRDGHCAAYNAKSIFQKGDINAVPREEFVGEDGAEKAFLLRDSYGEIFFDPFRKRYLRIAERHITEREYQLGERTKKRSVIFFDENFKIIGETAFPADIALSTLFFTQDGRMYTRSRDHDKSKVSFVRLEYNEGRDKVNWN